MKNIRLGQQPAKLVATGLIPLDDLYMHTRFQQLPGQIIGDTPAPDDHHFLDPPVHRASGAEKCVNILGRSYYAKPIPLGDRKIPLGNDGFSIANYHAYQYAALPKPPG